MIYDLNWYAVAAAILPGYLLVTVLHELSHGLVLVPYGWRFTIYPYPLFFNSSTGTLHFALTRLSWMFSSKPPDVQFYFALCQYHPQENSEPSNNSWALCHIAPRISNTVLIVGLFLTYKLFLLPRWTVSVFAVLISCLLIDFFVGIIGIFYWKRRDHTDIWKFQSCTKINLNFLRALMGTAFGGLLALLVVP